MRVLRNFLARLRASSRIRSTGDQDYDIDFSSLEVILQHRIKNSRLFYEALSHRSYLQVSGEEAAFSNERLEFLGDAILNLVVAEYLFHRFTSAHEGDLTKIRSRLVNRKALAIYARRLDLGRFLLMSPSASTAAGRGLETILSDAFEAIIGAVYLDAGYQNARHFIERTVIEALNLGVVHVEDENFKSRLLEYAQASALGSPRYIITHQEGPDHDRTFTVEVFLGSVSHGVGTGKNKKDAEQAAAEKALLNLQVKTG